MRHFVADAPIAYRDMALCHAGAIMRGHCYVSAIDVHTSYRNIDGHYARV